MKKKKSEVIETINQNITAERITNEFFIHLLFFLGFFLQILPVCIHHEYDSLSIL